MVAYNFKEEFADKVESGEKLQTIRKRRKRPTVFGDILQLYTGMRTKSCRLLRETKCAAVRPFKLWNDTVFDLDGTTYGAHISANGYVLAKKDGFKTWEEMVEFFSNTYGLPFEGEIIYWNPK